MTLNLLLVEDDIAYAEALAEELRAIGHATAIAGDGRQALTVMNEAAFDAVSSTG
jgi:two-component system OmpR family response regulator